MLEVPWRLKEARKERLPPSEGPRTRPGTTCSCQKVPGRKPAILSVYEAETSFKPAATKV